MCGRFASARKRQELLAEFRIERDRVTESLEPDYNVAPTKPVYAVLTRGKRGSSKSEHRDAPPEAPKAARGKHNGGRDEHGGARAPKASEPARGKPQGGRDEQPGARSPEAQEQARELRVVRWGLVPSWAKDPSIGSRLINARAETVDSKPAFRKAFTRRRCLLPADGFYEWLPVEKQGRKRKQPYYIHPADGGPLAFAGLYELWRDSSVPDDDPRAWLWTAVIITTSAQDEVGRIHDRMPMIIEPARWDDWLDPVNTDASDLRSLLSPALSIELDSYPVAPDVNYVRNNGPRLIEPLPAHPDRDGESSARAGDGWLASG
ncbi:MAG TPA: SOS response-associated peptidase, partial [Streptosporangiaceae bacterium]